MTKSEYNKYLKSDHWIQIRRKRKQIDNHSCYLCHKRKQLNVHHLSYAQLHNEDVENDLVTLCHDCHRMLHRIQNGVKKEYNNFLWRKDAESPTAFEGKLKEKIIEAIWLRDENFGGDLKVFRGNTKMINRFLKVVKILYPDIRLQNVTNDVRNELKKVSF